MLLALAFAIEPPPLVDLSGSKLIRPHVERQSNYKSPWVRKSKGGLVKANIESPPGWTEQEMFQNSLVHISLAAYHWGYDKFEVLDKECGETWFGATFNPRMKLLGGFCKVKLQLIDRNHRSISGALSAGRIYSVSEFLGFLQPME